WINRQPRGDAAAALLQSRLQRAARNIVADDANEQTARAQTGDIARDVAGPADNYVLTGDLDDRRRRLRRNARDVAINEIVEHQIANAEDRAFADGREL